jgi:hypothetical protein
VLQKLARMSKETLGSGLGRASGQGRGTAHSSKGSRHDVELQLVERAGLGTAGGTAGEGVMVSYDVWRRSEEAPPVPPKDGKIGL